ncbi:MAG: hypothetical protein DRO40_02950 [Thermoprotei archaeon]|nr:MAG: hypothetical protein DRO40_02950 [Thermoprotei archaeon]
MKITKEDLISIIFLLPLYIFLIVVVFIPLVNVVLGSFGISLFGEESRLTLEGYYKFMAPDSPYLYSLFFTIYISAIATVISILAGYLFAIYLTIKKPPVWRRVSTIMTIPLFTPYIVGAFMWWTLLFPRGYISLVINGLLMRLGLIHEPLPLVNDPYGIGILFGEVWIRFVIAVSIFYGPLQMINPELIDAARSLGANTWQIITKIFIPLTKYSIIATSAIILLATMAGVSIPLVLGGSWPQFLNVMIYLDVTTTFNYLMAFTSGVFYIIASATLGYIFFRFTMRRVIIQTR